MGAPLRSLKQFVGIFRKKQIQRIVLRISFSLQFNIASQTKLE